MVHLESRTTFPPLILREPRQTEKKGFKKKKRSNAGSPEHFTSVNRNTESSSWWDDRLQQGMMDMTRRLAAAQHGKPGSGTRTEYGCTGTRYSFRGYPER